MKANVLRLINIHFPDGIGEEEQQQNLRSCVAAINKKLLVSQQIMAQWINDHQPKVSMFLRHGTGPAGSKFFQLLKNLQEQSERASSAVLDLDLSKLSIRKEKISVDNDDPRLALRKTADVARIKQALATTYEEFQKELIDNRKMTMGQENNVDPTTKYYSPPLARVVLNDTQDGKIPKFMFIFLGPSGDIIAKRNRADENWHPFKVDNGWSKTIKIVNDYLSTELKLVVRSPDYCD